MSRNHEKAKATLNRWRTMGMGGNEVQKSTTNRRYASDSTSLPECEGRRSQLVESIGKKIEEIQHKRITTEPERERVKALNDEINKLMYIKFQWEKRIRNLGGPDYRTSHKDDYTYFGAAKELPEVKAFFQQQQQLHVMKRMKETEESDREKKEENEEETAIPKGPFYYGMLDQKELAMAEEREYEKDHASSSSASLPIRIDNESIHWDETWSVPTKFDVEQSVLAFKKVQLLRKLRL